MMRPFSRDHRSVSLLRDLCALGWAFADPARGPLHRPFYADTPAWNEGWRSCFPIGRCEGTLGSAPFRRLADLVGFGDKGTRDCATPNSRNQSCARRMAEAGVDHDRAGTRYNLAPKSWPTRAGRLKVTTCRLKA
jgi:hypothetical protein